MFSKNNKKMIIQKEQEKINYYGIKKFNAGTASVLIAAGFAFLGGGSALASNEAPATITNTETVNNNVTATKEEVSTTRPAKANKTNLSAAIARVQEVIANAGVTEKTALAIEDAKTELATAKALEASEVATQVEVDRATVALKNKAFVLESMKKATSKETDKSTEEKVNKNQDPRNGKAIPGKGESGFRDTGTVADGTENPVVLNINDITQKASELEVEIAKVESLISAENAKGEGQTDKELVRILTQVKESAQAVKNKGNNIPTTEKEKHALLQELKEKVDLLKLYQAKKLDWGAPANNHLANYGNNPSDAVISNLNDTFGTPDFSNATSHTKRVENQASGIRGAINLGSATYHWKQKEITVDEAKAGALGGWKIVDKEGANTVNIVKPEAPTDIEYKEGQSATTYAPKPAKVYDNNGHVTATGGQGRPNAGGGVLRYMISTDRLGNGSIGKVNKDYYVELKKQGTTIYKDFDVNPNSHLYANLVFSSAYGEMGLSSEGEKIKMRIVDAYTGQPLSELTRKDGKASDTEFIGKPGSDSDGFAALWRVVKVPEGTTKVRVFVEAGDQPTTSGYLNGHKVEDGYIVAGLGLTPGPALTLTTTVVSGRDKEAYGYTEDSIYKNAQQGTFNLTLSNHGGVGVVYQTRYEVTLKVPKGVKLGTLQGTDLNEVNGKSLFAPSYTYDFKYNKDTRELTFKIDLPKRDINPTSGKSNTVTIPFEVTPDFVGEATFEVVGKNGFGGKDKLGNMILPYGIVGSDRYNIPVNVNANSLETSDNPDYKYNRSIYIDSMTGNSTITVPVGTTFEKAKEAATLSTEELLNSEAYREKLATLKATAALNLSETSLIAMVQGYSTAAVKENSGTLKVPVIHTVGSKKFNNQIDINVNVVASTTQQKVVFEGDTIQNDDIKGKITPATIPGYTATTNNVQNLPTTTGKAGQIINVETTVSYTKGNVVLPETVTVPVLVLPKATGEVEVQKGASVDKVKEVAKAKATEVATSADFKAKLPEGSKDVVVGEITEEVLAKITSEKGTNKGIVKVPVTYTVDGTTYTKDAEITVNVLGSEPKTVYTVEGTKPDAEKVKNAVTPGTGGTVNAPTETALPETTGKVGAKDVTVPTTVTYPTGDETVNVPVEVLPKATPEKVTTLKDTTSNNLTTAVKEKAQAALGKLTLPSGVTAELDPNQTYAVPATDSNGDKTAVPVKVQYKDATGTVVAEDTINVPVTVVSSTPSKIVVFEGDEVTADAAKSAVTPGTDGTKGNPAILEDLTKTTGKKEVTVPVTYEGIKDPEEVKVPVTVLPKPEAEEILVAKNSDKEKAKEKVLAKAKKSIEEATFKGKLPQGATVEIDDTVPVTIPELTKDTEVEVTVKYTVPGQDKPLTTTVKVPVTVVEGVPQIVPVKETNDILPDPEKSIDKEDYPEGSTFRYKTPEGQTSPIDVTTPGDKNVVVEVLDPQGNTIVEVPATVRVVGSTPQFVVVDPAKKQPEAKDSVTPGEYPEGTTFEYKTPVDTTTAGEKDVTVVAKLNGQPIVEVPAKVVVVDPKTQYVVADPSKPQPDASKSIDPEQYPEGTTFEYKTPVDTTTPGEKNVVVVAKNGEDKLVEVPTKVKVVQGNPQIVSVDEGKKQPSPEDSIDPNDYPEDATFEYKEEVDTSTPGDKKVTVVVKQGDKVLVEVPSTVRVVESYPKYVPVDPAKKQPDPKENINPNDFPTGTTFEYKDNTPVDTATPGEKDVTVVAKLNGEPITEIPAKIIVVESKTQYVPVNAENDKKPKPQDSITPDDYPEGSTFEYKTPEGQTTPYDGTTPGEKDVTVVVKDSDGDPIVEVPAKIKVVQGKEQLTPVNAEDKEKPKAEDSITPSDYPEGSTFEYKVPEGQTTPYDGSTPGDKPVTVVVKDKDGKVLVEVPATIKVVESKPTPIETPVTNTPLTQDDYTKGMKIPEGATVKVGDLPDLTTPGEKTPVKVTITLPNGKSYTVDVPVTVTPIKEIETPVTTGKLTPEDILKQIKVPEGATTKVENIPDLTTPGKKDPVKVTVTLPNGKVVTVDVPVNVTPVKEIETPVTTEKLTPEDILKQIKVPEGATTNVGDLPDLTTPGKKDPVKVTVELPNGKVVTVEVPVNVTPVKEIETPVTTTPLTPEDYTKGIKISEGGKVTKVENIPDLTTPGKKDPVKVTVELPNGKVVTVDVPVNVTPVKEIETPVTTTPLTPEDYTKGITIPEGGKVTKVENIPDLTTPGKKTPVKVTVTLPNGKVVTVEVPVNVTPVKEIETPVTKDKLTPEDILKQIKVPEGATVEVGDLPNLTTPGKKDPVKVTITLPNGKVVTVEVPVNVTPITPIETPVTKDKLTPEDILKQIKVPEGATVGVGDLPDLTTPGKKDPVKVTITLPNGKVVVVEIPVTVTPIEDIVKKQGDPITAEDVEKHIPKGVKVISIGDKPTTDVPGERPSIPVVIELPNGIRITMNIPVIVTPKVTPVVVSVGTPVTPEEVQKHIELPKGWKVTKVGEIPITTTPGTKPVVKVEIELPDGRKITVDVPVIVTPTVRQIVVPQGTPITPDDVINHIDLPKEPGWEIVEVGEIPTTIPAGVKPSVKVKIKVPTGEIIEVDVPVIVTPKVTPIVVPVGTPITKEDVMKRVGLPEGWKIVEVGEIPTTATPGQKPSVKVKVKLPTGEIIEIEVPVTVTPKGVSTMPSTPTNPTRTENKKEPVVKDTSKVLPNTGINDSSSPLAGLGLAILGLATLVRRRKQK